MQKGRSDFLAEMSRVILILILMIIAFGGASYIRTFLTRRAIFKVIEIFYQHNALGINSAKTLHQLGLERPDFLQKMMSRRDYKQNALQILVKRGIIIENEDGRLYMVEEKLDEHLRSKRR
jgi:phage-related holin